MFELVRRSVTPGRLDASWRGPAGSGCAMSDGFALKGLPVKYGLLFLVAAVLMAVCGVSYGGAALLLLWPAVSFLVVSLAYLLFGPRLLGKRADGVLAGWAVCLLLPFHLYVWMVWHLVRVVIREPAFHWLTERVVIGRRLLSRELPPEVTAVVDLTSEFPEPLALRQRNYRSFPVLDGFVPPIDVLAGWIAEVRDLPGPVYVHCAAGHGRTGMFAACLLLARGEAATPDEALKLIRVERPGVRLGRRQRRAVEEFHRLLAGNATDRAAQKTGPAPR